MSRWRNSPRNAFAWLGRVGSILRWGLRLLLLFLVLDLFYLAVTWPDWRGLANGPVPKSAFMLDYEADQNRQERPARLAWRPVPLASIPRHMQRAVIVAEDSRFYEHGGFDLAAFKDAMDYNLNEGRFVMGASTISQQTVKNLFLSSSRSPLRKWHELILTWGMERHLSKSRIMELYLNIAEFGPGVYGVQAAAQRYWGKSVSDIDPREAAELAATLPSPTKNNPATRTRQFERRVDRIMRLMLRFPGNASAAIAAWRAANEPVAETGDESATAETCDDPCLDDGQAAEPQADPAVPAPAQLSSPHPAPG